MGWVMCMAPGMVMMVMCVCGERAGLAWIGLAVQRDVCVVA